jgi:F-type H+-transporting ATPase subunit b
MPTHTTSSTTSPGKSNFPPFQTENFPSQLFWLVLTFVLLYALMARVALPRIGSILAQRSKRIGDDIAAAERFKQRSEGAQADYQKALADAHARGQLIGTAERKRQAAVAVEIQRQLESQLHGRLAAAEQSIASTRAAAIGNVGTIAMETASVIVERLVGTKPAAHEVAAAVGDVIKG